MKHGARDADAIHRSTANELALMTEKVSPAAGDLVYLESLAEGGAPRKAQAGNLPGGGGGGLVGFGPFTFNADQLENPNSADWAENNLAPAEADDNNDGLVVRAFSEVGTRPSVGFTVFVPVGAVSLKLRYRSRARTGPAGAAVNLGTVFDFRGIPDGAAVEAWHGAVGLTTFSFPVTTEFFQYDGNVAAITLAFLSITAGRTYQFSFSRDNGTTDDLADDWLLHQLEIEFFDS